MSTARTVKSAPITRWFFIGLAIGIGVLYLSLWVIDNIPWRMFDHGGPQHAPEPLVLPWVSGGFHWAFLVLCVGITAAAIWLGRGRRPRVEPLALVAVCISVLGHAQGSRAATVISSSYHLVWPLNLTDVAVGILLTAAGVGVLAWARILLSKEPVRGRMFATSAVLCSLASAWWIDRFLSESYYPPLTSPSNIELPIVYHSDLGMHIEPVPEILIHEDGSASHEPLAELAAAMHQVLIDHWNPESGTAPDDFILIRADRRAKWAAVQTVVDDLQEVLIWKLRFATRWEVPATETEVTGFVAIGPEATSVGDHVVRIGPSGELDLDGDYCKDQSELLGRLRRLQGGATAETTLEVQPAGAVPWGTVLTTVSTIHTLHEGVIVGPLVFFSWA